LPVRVITRDAFRDRWNRNRSQPSHAWHDQFWEALLNSIIISGVGAAVGMFVASFASYIIIKSESPLGEFLNILTLSPTAIPGIVIAVSFFWIFVTYKLAGLFGTVWIIIIAFTAKFIVYGTRATNSSFRSLSDELEEAAQVSGANLFTIFKDIFIPLIKPGFVAGYLLLFIDYLKVLSIPLVLRGQGNTNLAVYIWDVNAAGYPSIAAAISTILIGIIFLLYTGIRFFTSYDLAEI
jgi:iron(III) transport system permease protein